MSFNDLFLEQFPVWCLSKLAVFLYKNFFFQEVICSISSSSFLNVAVITQLMTFSIKLLVVVLYFHRTEYWNFLVGKSCSCELNLNWLAFEIRKQPITSALLGIDFWELLTCCVVVDFWLGSTVYQSQHQFVVIGIWKCQKVGNLWPHSLCFVCWLLCYAFFSGREKT